MKKIILLATLAILAASTSFATSVSTSPVQLGSTSFATSTKVTLVFTSTTTAYTCASKHEQGDKKFSSSGSNATIAEVDCAKGTPITSEGSACP